PFEERLRLLQNRLTDPEPRHREIALDGAVEVAHEGPAGVSLGWDDVDGAWPRPSAEEALAQRRAGWALLVSRSVDSDDGVAERARAVVIREIQGRLRVPSTMAALQALPEHVS